MLLALGARASTVLDTPGATSLDPSEYGGMRRMAGGSDKRQRNELIPVRVTSDELAAINARADRAGLSRGAFLRAAALDTPGPRAQRRPPADHVALRQVLGQLGRTGNNLNQIARALNAGEAYAPAELHEALQACLEARDAILSALNMHPSHDHQRQEPRGR